MSDVDELARIVEDAELPALLPALAAATGDYALIRPAFRPMGHAAGVTAQVQGGLDADTRAEARAAAVEALAAFRAAGSTPAPPPTAAQLEALMTYLTGGEGSPDFFALMQREMGRPAEPARPLPGADRFRVAVVGAGMSGLAAAHRLGELGVPHVVFERNPDVGGVWFENTYPGCRLDTSNFNYSYSFAPNAEWTQEFSDRDSVFGYFSRTADELGLRDRIRFETEVLRLEYDEPSCTWLVVSRDADGTETTERFSIVVSAVGQLNRPKYPDIAGRETFAGPAWHTARWDHETPIAGRRVGVIGTGASAFQIIREIADTVGDLTIFQRNPPWVVPTPQYESALPAGQQWLLRNLPDYHRWLRVYRLWHNVEGRIPFAAVDPNWQHPVSISARNESLRELLAERMAAQYHDRPDLVDAMIPSYPPYAKRMLRDDARWAATLQQPHVHVVTEPIDAIVPDGVVTGDGHVHELDVLVYGTGFRAAEFLVPMEVVGRGGIDLHDRWDGDARAYIGMTVPDFPNLFMVYGPNTNLVVHGSVIMFSECAVDYLVESIRLLAETHHDAMDCRPEVYDAYNRRVDEANATMAWGASDVPSWYKNDRGRVSQNWPLPVFEYWKLTRAPDPADYEFLDASTTPR